MVLMKIAGSQVCNLAWSKNVNEIVSTHGYSQNQIIVWKVPSMTKLTSLSGHSTRVLYLAMSPDGQTVVTGAGASSLSYTSMLSVCSVPSLKSLWGAEIGGMFRLEIKLQFKQHPSCSTPFASENMPA